jgi:FixJ family two-component response regulator
LRIGEESGIELAHYLNRTESKHPFIFLTGFGTVSSAVEAMKQGALNYLEKPVDPSQLLSCVKDAIERHRKSMDKQLRFIHSPIIDQVLSERERQVMNLVLEGLLAKQIASRLGISTKTVEVHKSNMKRKLGVKSTVELIRLMK